MKQDTQNRGVDNLIIGEYYEVYKNLHNDLWSIRNPKNGLVEGHAKSAILQNCKFAVQPKGRAKVLREKRKNVHAFCRGTFIGTDTQGWISIATRELHSVSYDPYTNENFVTENNKPVTTAQYVILNEKGKVQIMDTFTQAESGLEKLQKEIDTINKYTVEELGGRGKTLTISWNPDEMCESFLGSDEFEKGKWVESVRCHRFQKLQVVRKSGHVQHFCIFHVNRELPNRLQINM
tara:strand:+ start:336 stop:1040 length:705 start_codon:yes stop_codon:yes gene_type:complete